VHPQDDLSGHIHISRMVGCIRTLQPEPYSVRTLVPQLKELDAIWKWVTVRFSLCAHWCANVAPTVPESHAFDSALHSPKSVRDRCSVAHSTSSAKLCGVVVEVVVITGSMPAAIANSAKSNLRRTTTH
jgi:hypothetical protein